jgi:hypothetical protein
MRKVLRRRGLNDDEIEVRIEELLQKNFPRLAWIIAVLGSKRHHGTWGHLLPNTD